MRARGIYIKYHVLAILETQLWIGPGEATQEERGFVALRSKYIGPPRLPLFVLVAFSALLGNGR